MNALDNNDTRCVHLSSIRACGYDISNLSEVELHKETTNRFGLVAWHYIKCNLNYICVCVCVSIAHLYFCIIINKEDINIKRGLSSIEWILIMG